MARKVSLAATLVSLVSAAALFVIVGPAPSTYATGYYCPSQGDHCYLYGDWKAQGGIQGIYANVESDCLLDTSYSADSTPGATGPYATNELWLNTSSDGTTWVEAGFTYGAPVGSYNYLFWAESYPTSGGARYLEHDTSNAAHSGKTYYVQIWKDTNAGTLWSAEVSGDGQFWSGTSVHPNSTNGYSADAGTEYSGANTDHFHTYSRQMNLGFYDGNHNAVSGWANSRGVLNASATPNGYTAVVVAGSHGGATESHSNC